MSWKVLLLAFVVSTAVVVVGVQLAALAPDAVTVAATTCDPDDEEEGMTPGNQDQPPPAGLCPAGPGPHDWRYDGYIRTCVRVGCGATESV